ncbi:MAG TPA: hypothetical protein VFV65_01570 [Gemmatimonadales bacterium]|nr:hypothetical protein [Gemmatimonadales bacterium]
MGHDVAKRQPGFPDGRVKEPDALVVGFLEGLPRSESAEKPFGGGVGGAAQFLPSAGARLQGTRRALEAAQGLEQGIALPQVLAAYCFTSSTRRFC